jgi:toxin ParE1/3/4
MSRARLSPGAMLDLRDAVLWIRQDNLRAALTLRQDVDRLARLIGANPNLGTARPELGDGGLRAIPLRRFPYVLVYDPRLSPVVIVRVFHGARDISVLLRGPTS